MEKTSSFNHTEIVEENKLSVKAHYDVIVIGGGVAGVSAAIAAARLGAKVLIIEKSLMFGGLATIGHINVYLPLCDGKGKKVCASIAEELLLCSIQYGYNTLPEPWKSETKKKTVFNRRYYTDFSPYGFVVALDEKVTGEKVDILFDTLFCSSIMAEGVCKAVVVENKGGRIAYSASYFIDATGDADLMYRANIPCQTNENYLSYWASITSFRDTEKGLKTKDMKKILKRWELGSNANGNGLHGNKKYSGLDAEGITEFVLEGRTILREKLVRYKHEGVTITSLPTMAQFRTTRRIVGEYDLCKKDINKGNVHSIGCAPDWRRRGAVYEVPFQALYNRKAVNIIAAGRCISSSGDSWEVTRVIPVCAVTGQAAGTAAYLALQTNRNFPDLDVEELQDILENNGAIIHYNNV